MKLITLILAVAACASVALADSKVSAVKGQVYVRHGIQEAWVKVAVGDVLKPDDTIRLDAKSSATIVVDGVKKLVVPELVVIDLSDLRALTQEEFLLKLAMEDVRSVRPSDGREIMNTPRTTTMHGEQRGLPRSKRPGDVGYGSLELNGARLLFDHGYYATSVLKSKEVFRRIPALKRAIDARLTVALALEKMRLQSEALEEYTALNAERLNAKQKTLVSGRIAVLRRAAGR